jgi:hypothetical protein
MQNHQSIVRLNFEQEKKVATLKKGKQFRKEISWKSGFLT